MSLSMVQFSAGDHHRVYEADYKMIDVLERISIVLGAVKDDDDPDHFYFELKTMEKSIQALEVIDLIWNSYIPTGESVHISCGKEVLVIEGNSKQIKAFLALIQLFDKNVTDGYVEFPENKRNCFNSICEVAETLGIIP